jgi:hypothetical protein
MSADPIAALCVELSGYASGRVWGIELPRDEIDNDLGPRDNIVLSLAGRVPSAGDNSYIKVGRVRVDVRVYGADPLSAWELYLVVHDALKAIRPHTVTTDAGDVLLDNCVATAGPFTLRDPDIDWPFVLGVFGVHYHEEAIAAAIVSS